ncbi:SlyX family protein [Psychrobacter sp.]|uniref:SlyX family protein n=1 Tax=unclassified Psychrobacter TaxID=196806 RepID=UPI003F97CBE3
MNPSNTKDNAENNAQTDDSVVQAELQIQQVVDLQMSMAHLEVIVDRLDEVIARQDKDIQTLQRQLQLIYKQVENQDTDSGIAPFDVMTDRPPHY